MESDGGDGGNAGDCEGDHKVEDKMACNEHTQIVSSQTLSTGCYNLKSGYGISYAVRIHFPPANANGQTH